MTESVALSPLTIRVEVGWVLMIGLPTLMVKSALYDEPVKLVLAWAVILTVKLPNCVGMPEIESTVLFFAFVWTSPGGSPVTDQLPGVLG